MRQGTRREVLRSSHPNGNFIWRRAELWEAGTPAVPSGSQIQRTSESRALFSPGCTNLSSRHLGFCLWGWFFFGLRIVHSVRKALHCSTAQTEHDLCCCCSQRAQNWAPPVRTLCSGSALTQSWGSLSRNGSPSVSIPPGLCLKVPEKPTIHGHDVLVGWGQNGFDKAQDTAQALQGAHRSRGAAQDAFHAQLLQASPKVTSGRS